MRKIRSLGVEVSAAVTLFEQLINSEVPADTEALSKARVRLVRAVNMYIAYLGPRVGGSDADEGTAHLKEALGKAVELRKSYSEHIARFDSSSVSANWPTYRASCLRLIEGMREHLKDVGGTVPRREAPVDAPRLKVPPQAP